jgi:hypothetical protein
MTRSTSPSWSRRDCRVEAAPEYSTPRAAANCSTSGAAGGHRDRSRADRGGTARGLRSPAGDPSDQARLPSHGGRPGAFIRPDDMDADGGKIGKAQGDLRVDPFTVFRRVGISSSTSGSAHWNRSSGAWHLDDEPAGRRAGRRRSTLPRPQRLLGADLVQPIGMYAPRLSRESSAR